MGSAEYKLTSLIVMSIFNNDHQFIIGEEETLRAIIRAVRNVSRNYKLLGRETVREPFIDKCVENHIKNQLDNVLNGADIYGLHF